jgi:Relaxase/Mobilisation nuclease domain
VPIIINGGSRSSGSWWSKHLGNEETNEQAQVIEYRDLSATTMRAAFYEMEALAAGTKCDNYFYQANINPRADEVLTPAQWREAVDTLERNLGLTGQPRFIVQHEKEGRVHQHVVWSRIDVENGVAISDSLTAQIHEQTSRELEIRFDLEHGKSVLVPDRDFDRPDRRLKKWETFRGDDTGLDPTVMKAELTAIRQRCDNGTSFRAALEDSDAYVLARGDRRDYVIIDRFGDDHSLARRLDLRAAELRRFMADLDPATIPSVDEAKVLQREQQERSNHWDRDADSAAWETSVQDAAIAAAKGKAKTQGAAVATAAEKDAPAARGEYAALKTETATAEQDGRSVGKTAGDIRAALAASRDNDPELAAEKLEAELKQRGIGLAAVTAEEAYASERRAAFAREVGNRSRTLAEGEILVVDGRGNAYRLNERVTGQTRRETEAQLVGVDRVQLPGVEATKDAMREASKAAWRVRKEEEQAQARLDEPVTGARAEIRTAFTLAPDGPDAAPLQEALAARGMTLARVTGVEAIASQEQAALWAQRRQEREAAAAATAEGRYAALKPDTPEAARYSPRLREGELVVVDQRGSIYKLDERSTGLRAADIQSRLAGLEDLLTVTDAQAALRQAARESWVTEQAAAREQAREPNRIENRIAECARLTELSGAHIQVDADDNRVSGAAALADRLRPEDQRRTTPVIIHGSDAFSVRLEEAGIALVRVTDADVKALAQLRQDETMARQAAETNREAYRGNRFDACIAGDLAAVTRWGDVYRINPDKIGAAARSLTGDLPGVIEARAQFEIDREQKNDVWLQIRLQAEARRDERDAARQEREEIAAGARAVHGAVQAVEGAGDVAERGAGMLLKGLSNLMEGIFGFLVPGPRLTRAQAERAALAAEERDEVRVDAMAARRERAARDWEIFQHDRQREQEDRAVLLGLGTAPIDRRPTRSRDELDRDRY